MKTLSNINCTYYNSHTGGCKHPDKDTYGCGVASSPLNKCNLQESYPRPEPPPPPPPKKK